MAHQDDGVFVLSQKRRGYGEDELYTAEDLEEMKEFLVGKKGEGL